MRRGTIPVFDDYVQGTDAVYSSTQLSAALAHYDRMALQLIADKVAGTTPTLAAKLQTSNDGQHWEDRPAGLAATTITAGQVNSLAFADSGASPAEGLCRLKLTLGAADNKARIRVSATVRDCKGGPWLPTSETGLALWLRGGDWSLDGSGDIATWTDLSGNGRDYSPTTNAPSPDGLVSGQAAVKFDPTNTEFLVGPSFSSLTAGNVFIVTQLALDPPANTLWVGLWRFGSHSAADAIPYTDGNIYDGFGSTVRKDCGDPTGSFAEPNVYEVRTVSGAWSDSVNGTQLHSTGSNTVGWHTSSELGHNDTVYMNGAMAEVIIYDRVLDESTRRNVMQYLGGKYGIEIP